MADTRRRAETLVRKISEAKEALDKLDKVTVAELLRRGEETSEIDGYGAGQDGESRSSVGDHSDPTLSAVMARESDSRADPIAEAIEDICARIVEMHGHARVIDRKRQVVLNAASALRGRVSAISQCHSCGRDVAGTKADPIVSGYCRACRKAWERAGYPDRLAFERARRGQEGPDEEWRIAAVADLQERDELPKASGS